MAKLSQITIDDVNSDPDLFAVVCKAAKIKPTSLPETLKRNGNKINQFHVIQAIADYKKCDPKDLLEEENQYYRHG